MSEHLYCVVMPLVTMPVGRWVERAHWPRHVTVCSDFRAEPGDLDVLAAVVARVAAEASPPTATVAEDALFGPDDDVPVQLVESDALHLLHLSILEAIGAAVAIDSVIPGHNGTGYRPHVTVADHRLEPGSILTFSSLLLVEIAPEHDRAMAVPVAIADLGASDGGEPVSADRAAHTMATLEDAGLHPWVIGGWGIDALVGRQTREHHDVDLFVLDTELTALLELVESPDSRVRYLWSENRWHDRLPSAFVADIAGVEVDVHIVALEGDVTNRLSAHSTELPPGALSGSGRIAERQVACATAEAQRVMHTGYELPEKQLHDLAVLRESATG